MTYMDHIGFRNLLKNYIFLGDKISKLYVDYLSKTEEISKEYVI